MSYNPFTVVYLRCLMNFVLVELIALRSKCYQCNAQKDFANRYLYVKYNVEFSYLSGSK